MSHYICHAPLRLCIAWLLAGLAMQASGRGATIAEWQFETGVITTTNSTFFRPADTGSGVLVGQHFSSLTSWGSSGVVGNGSPAALRSNQWNIYDYMQIDVDTVGHSNIFLQFDQTQSVGATQPTEFTLQVSLDGATFSDIDDYTVLPANWTVFNTNTTSRYTFDLAGLSFLDNQPSLSFRLLYSGYNPTLSPASRMLFDNIIVGSGAPGGSDFTNVLNLPVDGNIAANTVISNDTQVNVYGGNYNPSIGGYDNGEIGSGVTAGTLAGGDSHIEINVYGPDDSETIGGEINGTLLLREGAQLNMRGGQSYGSVRAELGSVNLESGAIDGFIILDGGQARIDGGFVGPTPYFSLNRMIQNSASPGVRGDGSSIDWRGGIIAGSVSTSADSTLATHGGEYLLNGAAVPGLGGVGSNLTLQLAGADVLTGTLADGTPFAVSGDDVQGDVQLFVSDLPAAGSPNVVIDDVADVLPAGVRAGQTLVIDVSNSWYQPLVVGAGATAQLLKGQIYDTIQVLDGAVCTVDDEFTVKSLYVDRGGQATISGGSTSLHIQPGAVVDVLGGQVNGYRADAAGATLNLHGGGFRVNGLSVPGLANGGDSVQLDLAPGDVLTGELADGRPMMMYGGEALADGVLHLTSQSPPPPAATTVSVTSSVSTVMAREGQTFNVLSGGQLPVGFDAGFGSRVHFQGGGLTSLNALGGSEVIVSAGNLTNDLITALAQSQVTIEGGTGVSLHLDPGASATVNAGTVATIYSDGGQLDVHGGEISWATFHNGSTVDISGGSIGNLDGFSTDVTYSGGVIDNLRADSQVTLTLIGSNFNVGGTDVTSLLSTTTPYVVSTRNMLLAGTLADGTLFSELLAGSYQATGWYALSNATVQLLRTDTGGTFANILNLPADGNIEDYATIANDTQVNVHGGNWNPETEEYDIGTIGFNVTAGTPGGNSNIEINVYGPDQSQEFGGEVGSLLTLYEGATLNLVGGYIYGQVTAYEGSSVNVTAGNIDDSISLRGAASQIDGGNVGYVTTYGTNRMIDPDNSALDANSASSVDWRGGFLNGGISVDSDSSLAIRGGEYLLNGSAVPGMGGVGSNLALQLADSDILTGTLADGTPFAINGEDVLGDLQLFVTDLPAAGPSTIVVDDYADSIPIGVRAGQTLTFDSQYSFTDGPLVVGAGGTANLLDGAFDAVQIVNNGVCTIDGDFFCESVLVDQGGQATILGCRTFAVHVEAGATVDVHGGRIGGFRAAATGASLTLHGGGFRVNGTLVAGLANAGDSLQLDLAAGDVLTGELADGSPVMLYGGNALADGVLRLKSDAPVPPVASIIDVTTSVSLNLAREGQTINVLPGGQLPYSFEAAYGSTVNFVGGNTSGLIALGGSQIAVVGGNVTGRIDGLAQSQVSVEGGSLNSLRLSPDAVATVAIGSVTNVHSNSGQLDVLGGAVDFIRSVGGDTDVRGGTINRFTASEGSTTEFSGGYIGKVYGYQADIVYSGGTLDNLELRTLSTLTLVGTSFSIGGTDVTSLLSTTTPYVVSTRNMLLAGTLADGTLFSELLAGSYQATGWYALSNATVQLLLAPPAQLAGDFNLDGVVDAADYTVWRDGLGDIYTQADYELWRNNFGATAAPASVGRGSVPEPATWLALAVVSGISTGAWRRTRCPCRTIRR